MFTGKILILGASGYIGAQLVPQLLEREYRIRACGRSISKLEKYAWSKHSNVELKEVDVLDIESLKKVAQGCDIVYYLVHSMNAHHKDFAKADRTAAQNMAQAAHSEGLKRIIYLGGLGEDDEHLSHHLRSRMEVSRILREGSVPVTTLRSAMIIGKGSVSFEILRALVKNLPIMITPRWVSTESQPIAVSNVLNYLVGCLETEKTIGKTFDIGGPDIVSYRRLMDIYAQESNTFKRLIIPIPLLTPNLSSLWISLVTPYPSYIARPLAEGLKNRVVCHDHRIRRLIPQELFDCRKAIQMAIQKETP